jgi:hypothetical protein
MKLRMLLPLLALSVSVQPALAQVWISEFMASGAALKDEDGDTPDWVEIWNDTPAPLALGGWHLTDNAAKLAKWTFPATNLASGQFLVVFASGKDRSVAGAPLHTNFKLSSAGEYLGLVEADGQTIAHQYSPGYPEQAYGVSYGIAFDTETTNWVGAYLTQPTPGATNSTAYLGLVGDIQMSVPRGFVDMPLTVAISTATAGAEIRFTTNGTAPTSATGILYAGPVPIARNTVLRAIATKPGYKAAAVATQTYIGLGNVITQNLQTALNAGFPASWGGGGPASYAMNPAITGPNGPQMPAVLGSLPSVFLTAGMSDLFDPVQGIYANASEHGVEWERPASIEWLDTNGVTTFQADCGLRIQGGVGRMEPKKSFRLLFKREYGGSLRYDLFQEPDAVQEFHSLILRAGFNDSWFWLSGSSGKATYVRDEFGRRLLLAMGHPSARGLFVHLYIDGLYWGLYNLTERPNADFSASYLGGQANDWDAIKAGEVRHGDLVAWNTFLSQVQQPTTAASYRALQGNNPDGTPNARFPVFFDKLDYIDYMLLNYWGGNWDWPEKNFWLGRNRTSASTGFKCYPWDIEGIVDDAESSLNMVVPRDGDDAGVGVPHHFLKTFSEYKLDFADRIQKFFFNGGLLTPQVLTNRFLQLANRVESAIVAESARWGDGNLGIQSQAAWLRELNYILTTYLQQRTAVVLGQFVGEGLYPNIGPPVFHQFGGTSPARWDVVLTQTNSTGTIYFTLDGSDPRLYGLSTPAPVAQAYMGPVTLTGPTTVRARVLKGAQWSALVEATFDPSSAPLFSRIYTGRNTVLLQFEALANQSYSVLWSAPPFTSGWNKLLDFPDLPMSYTVTLTNSVLEGPSRFFRLASPALP